ncbi:hypothetical protein BGZ46_009239 [Entomortierella lignicola]|nr:hypothetical protein BGZ46_009239 [Entomortierella lignicola]
MGSRAYVLDPVSLLIGPKEFPLYGKGQERHRFEYGVFLLNKDIEQLLNSQGLQCRDLRQTLPNLRKLMETLLTSSPTQSTLYRSKVVSLSKQDHQEQERLNDLFIISLEQRDFDQILHPGSNIPSGNGGNKDQKALGTEGPLYERTASTTKTNYGGERSSLLREYDPIEGDYMLILDDSSTKSLRSRKEASNSDVSTTELASGRTTPVPLTTNRIGHHKALSSLRHGYISSVSSSIGDSDDDEDSDTRDTNPTFHWAGEVADALNHLEGNDDGSEHPETNAKRTLANKIDSKIDSNNGVDFEVEDQLYNRDEQPHSIALSSNSVNRISGEVSNPPFKNMSTDVETTSVDATGPQNTAHSPSTPTISVVNPSQEPPRAQTIERVDLSSDEQTEIEPRLQQKEQEDHVSEDGSMIHGPTSASSPESPTTPKRSSISSWTQRDRRLSDKHMENNGDGDMAERQKEEATQLLL